MDLQVLLDFLVQKGQIWIQTQRNLHRPTARPLTSEERRDFGGFFDPQTLDSARVKKVQVIHNPPFYNELRNGLRARGIQIPLDFTQMSGITHEDTILISTSQTPSYAPLGPLLLHELVHVVQYETLGVQEFVRRCIQGWAQNGFQYAAIPLERDAYDLQSRYESQPQQPFSVRAEVRRRLGLS